MDAGGGLNSAAGDSTASEAMPTLRSGLQATGSWHSEPKTAKMTKAALPAQVAHAIQHPHIL